MKQASIIIVTYNSEKDIYDCVDSIQSHADIPREDIELIIVDNCSREPEPMFARLRQQWGEDIVLIENTQNGGYGQGNNVGIRRATAPVILIMNPDVRLMDPFFARPLKAFKEDSQLIMYGMKQMYTETMPSRNSFWFTTMMNGYLRTLLTGLCTRMDWYLPRWMYISGSCFFVRKSMFEAVGLFDEEVFMYGEEDDIHYRLMQRFGLGFRYDKSIRYIHLMLGRQPDIRYEEKLLDVDLYHHKKKGRPAIKTLTTYLQINTTLLARGYLMKFFGKGDRENFAMLKAFRQVIKSKLKNS